MYVYPLRDAAIPPGRPPAPCPSRCRRPRQYSQNTVRTGITSRWSGPAVSRLRNFKHHNQFSLFLIFLEKLPGSCVTRRITSRWLWSSTLSRIKEIITRISEVSSKLRDRSTVTGKRKRKYGQLTWLTRWPGSIRCVIREVPVWKRSTLHRHLHCTPVPWTEDAELNRSRYYSN